MDIERMTDEQISEYIKLRQQENSSDYSYQPKGSSKPGVMGTALVELDKDGNPRKSKQYLNSITPKLGASKGTTDIDAEIKRLTALKAQNNQTQTTESNKPADGIYNPADYIGQIANKMNDQSPERGNNFSKSLDITKNAGRRTGFEQDTDGTPLPETAYEWIVQQMSAARARGPINEYTLKAIENGAKVRYNVPSKFKISGPGGIIGFLNGNTAKSMAKAMNSMPYNGKAQTPQKPAQKPIEAQSTQSAQEPTKTPQKPAQDISPKTKLDDERTAAYKKIKAKQASDADLALFKNYTEEQLKKVGFGPVSIAAIKGTASKTPQQSPNNSVGDLTDEEKQFMKQYKTADPFKSEGKKFKAENFDRYQELMRKKEGNKKANKNANKIKYLKGQLEAHKNVMAANPDRQDIQKAQQWYVDDLTKKIQALGGSVD